MYTCREGFADFFLQLYSLSQSADNSPATAPFLAVSMQRPYAVDQWTACLLRCRAQAEWKVAVRSQTLSRTSLSGPNLLPSS